MTDLGAPFGESDLLRGTRYRLHTPVLILAIILSTASLLYYSVLAPERFGAYHDDSIYAATAKALATSQGYKIISLPLEPAQTKYPPFYPFLLSLIWRAYPQFPENIVLLTMLSTIATLSFLALAYRYLTKHGYTTEWQALIVVGLAAINWRTMILATSIYSEMVYAAFSVAALYLAERGEASKRGRDVLLGIVIGMAFLTRTSGLTLLLSITVYYVLRRRWGKALVVFGVGSLFVLGWIGWCYANKDTEGVNAGYYGSYFRDISGMIRGLQIENGASKVQIILTVLQQNFFSAIVISIPIVCSGLNYESIPGLGEFGPFITACSIFLFLVLIMFGFLRQSIKGFRLLHMYVVLYLALHLPVPYISYDRYLVPLLPFLLMFLVTELGAAVALARKGVRGQPIQNLGVALIVFLVTSTICIAIYGYSSGIKGSIAMLKTIYANAIDERESVQWINAYTDPSEILVCYRDPTYYLYTHRKAIPLTITKAGNSQQPDPSLLITPISNAGAKYLVTTSIDFEHDYDTELQREALAKLLEEYSKTFVLVFESTNGHTRIYRINNNAT